MKIGFSELYGENQENQRARYEELARGFEEYFASAQLTELLRGQGFAVETGTAGLPTAFTAVKRGRKPGPSIAFLAESCITLSLPLCYFRLDPPMHRLNVLARRKSLEIGPAEECFCSYIRSHFHR